MRAATETISPAWRSSPLMRTSCTDPRGPPNSLTLALREARGGPAKGELRGALGREGGPSFDEIRTERRGFGQRAIGRRLPAHAGGDGVDGSLPAADRHLAHVREAPRVTQHGLLQRRLHATVDKADRQRLVGLDPARGEQKILGARRADEFDQAARLGLAIDEAGPGRP